MARGAAGFYCPVEIEGRTPSNEQLAPTCAPLLLTASCAVGWDWSMRFIAVLGLGCLRCRITNLFGPLVLLRGVAWHRFVFVPRIPIDQVLGLVLDALAFGPLFVAFVRGNFARIAGGCVFGPSLLLCSAAVVLTHWYCSPVGLVVVVVC